MLFRLAKLLGWLAFPSTLIFVALVLGLIALLFATRRPRLRTLGLGLIVAATAAYGALALTPVWWLLAQPLETRFPQLPADAPAPAGIVFIGGVVDGATEPATGRTKYELGAEAVDETVRLARRYPEVPIVLSGTGSMRADGTDLSEAGTMARMLIAAGVRSDRLILERRSRTTRENATMSFEMVRPAPGARWLLVTPAWHMPRSIGAFRGAGWTGIVAAPSLGEHLYRGNADQPPSERLHLVDVMSREWLGLLAYRLLGRSPSLFPAP